MVNADTSFQLDATAPKCPATPPLPTNKNCPDGSQTAQNGLLPVGTANPICDKMPVAASISRAITLSSVAERSKLLITYRNLPLGSAAISTPLLALGVAEP